MKAHVELSYGVFPITQLHMGINLKSGNHQSKMLLIRTPCDIGTSQKHKAAVLRTMRAFDVIIRSRRSKRATSPSAR